MNKKSYNKFIAKLYKFGAVVKWIDEEHGAIKFSPKSNGFSEVYVTWSAMFHCPYVAFSDVKSFDIGHTVFLDKPSIYNRTLAHAKAVLK